MKSIAHVAPETGHEATPAVTGRNNALDRARTFLTIIVLIHHAVIPYTYFGHTDPTSWIGFDAIVLATDSFFMAMFFMLSGLFVWPSLARRVPWAFTRDRALRLLLPFAIAALTVIPIAYYAIALRQDPSLHFTDFWWKTVTVGPWPSGPVWFTWVLFVFDFLAGFTFRTNERSLDGINRLSGRGFDRPAIFFLFLVTVTAIVYVPSRLYYGPSYWFEFGPFSVQASRVLLYAAYFFIGAGIGVASSGVDALIRAVYHLLGLRTYLTTGEQETRAWTIRAGDKAPAAAGVIHTDFERGFIAAETVHFDDLISLGSHAKAREAGKLRIEGKEYVVKDGDVMEFRFNV